MEEQRSKGITVLSKVLKNKKKINKIEELLFNSSNQLDYKRNLYQVTVEIMNDKDLDDICMMIQAKNLGWNQKCFDDIRNKILEQDSFIQNPFNIAKGVLTCKCGSDRVFSYSKMTRSGDEAMTTFAECVKCKKKWTQS